MSLSSGFFNSVNHDRLYNAEDMSRLFDGLIRDGVFASIGTCMVVKANTKMTVNVGIGRAWFNHTWTLNDSILPITLEQSHVLWPRIDAVVIEVNSEENVRENFIKVVQGEPSTNPTKPTLTKSVLVNQYPLAYITVPAAATEIRQADIENTVGTTECPFVSGILSVISIEELIPQWKDILNRFVEENTANFNTWMNNEKTAYAQWLQSNKDDYNKLVKDQTASYQTWFDGIKNNYTNWFASIKEAYDTNWKAFQQWESTSKTEYNSWFSGVKSTYDSNWRDFQAWEAKTKDDFDAWYETVQNQLSGDVVAKINDQIDQINAKMLSLIDASEGTVEGTVEAPIVLAGATRNLIDYSKIPSVTHRGVTFTNNNDGSFSISGKNEASGASYTNKYAVNVDVGKRYKICLEGSSVLLTVRLNVYKSDNSTFITGCGPNRSAEFTPTEPYVLIYLYVSNGAAEVTPMLTVKPMLTTDLDATYDDFVPYDGYDIVSAGPKLLTGAMRKYPYAAYKDGSYDATTQTVTFGSQDNSGAYLSLNDYIYLKSGGQYTLSVDVEASAAISGATIGVEGTGFNKYVTSLAAGKSTQTFDFTYSGSKLSFVCYAKGMSGKTVKLSNMKILRKGVTEANYGLYQDTNSVHIGPDTKFPLYGLHSYDGNTTIISPSNFEAYTVDQYNGKALLESAKLGVEAKREKVGLIKSDDKHLPDTIKAPLMVTGATRNLLKSTLATTTINGVTCTNNGNGTYTLNGTATSSGEAYLDIFSPPKDTYILTGGINAYIRKSDDTWMATANDSVIFSFDPSDGKKLAVFIWIEKDTVYSNVLYKPMLTTDLNATYDDFVPYSGYDVKTCGKNLSNCTMVTTTTNGVTCTNNGDGTYTLNGTSTDNIDLWISTGVMVIKGFTYVFGLGCNDIAANISAYITNGTGSVNIYPSIREKFVYAGTTTIDKVVHLRVLKNAILNNVLIKPMLTTDLDATLNDFEPYVEGPTIHIDSSTQFPLMGLETMEGETNIISPTHIETYHTDDENGKVLLEMIYKAAESGGIYYSSTTPTGAKTGDFWIKPSSGELMYYDGKNWALPKAGDVIGSDVVKSSTKPMHGRDVLWIDSANNNVMKHVDASGNVTELAAGGVSVGTSAPANTKLLWIDTSSGGVAKYYNGSAWVATASVWG